MLSKSGLSDVPAGAFHLAGTEHPPGVGEQDDFEQDFGVDGGRAGLVVVVARVERREVNVLFDHFVDGGLQAAGDELGFERDGQHHPWVEPIETIWS